MKQNGSAWNILHLFVQVDEQRFSFRRLIDLTVSADALGQMLEVLQVQVFRKLDYQPESLFGTSVRG